jgi:putative tricarboxylic transport membrane protein
MKKPWQIASLIFVFLSLFVLIHSFSYSYKDRLGPGPGFFPFWMSLITGILSLALFLQTTFAKSEKEEKKSFFPNREGGIRIALILVSLAMVVVFLNPLGFRISLLLFLLFLPFALGVRNWPIISIVAVAGSFGIFHAFYYWLKVPLPIGFFGI